MISPQAFSSPHLPEHAEVGFRGPHPVEDAAVVAAATEVSRLPFVVVGDEDLGMLLQIVPERAGPGLARADSQEARLPHGPVHGTRIPASYSRHGRRGAPVSLLRVRVELSSRRGAAGGQTRVRRPLGSKRRPHADRGPQRADQLPISDGCERLPGAGSTRTPPTPPVPANTSPVSGCTTSFGPSVDPVEVHGDVLPVRARRLDVLATARCRGSRRSPCRRSRRWRPAGRARSTRRSRLGAPG